MIKTWMMQFTLVFKCVTILWLDERKCFGSFLFFIPLLENQIIKMIYNVNVVKKYI